MRTGISRPAPRCRISSSRTPDLAGKGHNARELRRQPGRDGACRRHRQTSQPVSIRSGHQTPANDHVHEGCGRQHMDMGGVSHGPARPPPPARSRSTRTARSTPSPAIPSRSPLGGEPRPMSVQPDCGHPHGSCSREQQRDYAEAWRHVHSQSARPGWVGRGHAPESVSIDGTITGTFSNEPDADAWPDHACRFQQPCGPDARGREGS